MIKRLIPGLMIITMTGCFSLEPFYYQNVELNEYFGEKDMKQWENYRGIIPDELIVADSFTAGTNTIFAFWALQEPDTVTDTTAEPDTSIVTVLYNHGNYHNINHYWDKVEFLWEMGYRVYIYDYPGFGRSTGEPTSETCYESAEMAYFQVISGDVAEINASRLVYYGMSLGGYMTTFLAADISSPAAAIMESCPASTSALMKDSGLLDLPGGIVSADDYDSQARIADIGCPLLLMHGRMDDYITFDNHAVVLWEAASEPKDSFWVDEACHGNVSTVDCEAYQKKVTGFISEYVEK
ncbi:alpha/beta fold hydrolase [candidate division WOR-3 bacterium]|uniref:Alpha/beta fold hydrolase n=1 Tax=candidate division WOR-3 bacterium TaxID=2052148 RepID=A0A9D5K992_UNCW3|nr:alpha/beta fold hydrolase [candidate division WOR-3 bacterium]MBD3363741.1 alpha/beta fold hydrolase [candidate division WOR-3 bacterium]